LLNALNGLVSAEDCAKVLPNGGARQDSEFLPAQSRSFTQSYALLDKIERTLRGA
jgi:hypothetical protein